MDCSYITTVKIAEEEVPDAVIWEGRFFYIDVVALLNNEGYTRPIYFEGSMAYAVPEH